MTDTNTFEAIKDKAIADREAGAPPPPTLPTIAQQNWYDTNRNS